MKQLDMFIDSSSTNDDSLVEESKVIILPGNGFISDIVEYIRVTAKRNDRSIEEQAAMYKLTAKQCKELGILPRVGKSG